MLESEGDQNLAETSLGLYIGIFCLFGDFFFKDYIYFFDRESTQAGEHQREREKEKEAPLYEQQAQHGARSQDTEILT